ncbi:MAG: ketopantoate reductase family protein [Bacteroidota bacterium]
MKILIMGSGGVGGYYGGLLAENGHEVTFVARGAHLQAIRENGLRVKSIFGDFNIVPASAVEDPAEAGTPDFILFSTKTYDTDDAAKAIRPAVGPGTAILSLQNGVDAAERIGSQAGMEHMLAGASWISSAVEAPGIIKQISQFRRIVLGELDGTPSPRAQAIFDALNATGVTVELSDNILKVLWTKFVFIAAQSSIGSLTRLPVGGYRSVPETRAMMTGLMQEVASLARAQGIALDRDLIQKTMDFVDNQAPHIKPSMQVDVEAGRRTEIESMIGVIGRKGRELGIPTPIADFVYAALLPVELKARAGSRADA